jgi:glycosyltransferase involved in cell wall biosynthesis
MTNSKVRGKICFVTTVPYQVNVFLEKHVLALLPYAEVIIITNQDDQEICELPNTLIDRARICHVPFRRTISPVHDLCALLKLMMVLHRERPLIVQSISPKAGLLCAIAGWLLQLPIRVHWFTGQVWVTKQGLMRKLLKTLDTLIAKLTTNLLADSPSQMNFLIQQGVVQPAKIEVLGNGSVCGVNVDRFQPNPKCRSSVRQKYGVPDNAILGLFVGRVTPDKGVLELAQAVRILKQHGVSLYVAFIGPDEANMSAAITLASGSDSQRIIMTGFSSTPESFMSAADFLVLPSYREGFGSTIIEAAACGIPAIGTRIYGIIDAIEEGETGLLVEPRNIKQLADAMRKLSVDEELRMKLGIAARMRVVKFFQTKQLNEAIINYFDRLLRGRGHSALVPGTGVYKNFSAKSTSISEH